MNIPRNLPGSINDTYLLLVTSLTSTLSLLNRVALGCPYGSLLVIASVSIYVCARKDGGISTLLFANDRKDTWPRQEYRSRCCSDFFLCVLIGNAIANHRTERVGSNDATVCLKVWVISLPPEPLSQSWVWNLSQFVRTKCIRKSASPKWKSFFTPGTLQNTQLKLTWVFPSS